MNFSFVPVLVVTSHYFVRYRSLAMGITASGCGIGMFYFPPLARLLLDSLSFREAVMCMAGLYLQIAPVAMFLRPESSW